MSLSIFLWSRSPWVFSYRPSCKGSPFSSLIQCIGVGLDPDFGPLCFRLFTSSPDVFCLCFSCHTAMMLNLGTGLRPLLPALSWHYPWGPPPPGPPLQTHFFPEMNTFSLQIPPPHLPLTPRTLTLFSSFSVFAAAHHLLFFFVPKSTLPSRRPRPHTVCNHTLEVINTAVLRPLLFYLHCPPTFTTWVFPARTKI